MKMLLKNVVLVLIIFNLIAGAISIVKYNNLMNKKQKALDEVSEQINKLITTCCTEEHDFEDKIYMTEDECNNTIYFTKCKKCDCIKKYNLLDELN